MKKPESASATKTESQPPLSISEPPATKRVLQHLNPEARSLMQEASTAMNLMASARLREEDRQNSLLSASRQLELSEKKKVLRAMMIELGLEVDFTKVTLAPPIPSLGKVDESSTSG